jgi:solanesyl diphosphate synthase
MQCTFLPFARVTPFGSIVLSQLRQLSTVSPAAEEVNEPVDRAKRLLHKLNRSAFHLDEQPVLKKYENKQHLNPLNIVEEDLKIMNKNIRNLLSTNHMLLETIANYYFQLQGKKIRPVIILLMSRALSHHQKFKTLLNTDAPCEDIPEIVLPKQLQLAEIVEMIHTASIIHDDVIDDAQTRRGVTAVNVQYGNKVAILVGDFLLARASISLAQLGNHEVTELMSRVLGDLVQGEFMQSSPQNQLDFDYYMEKTYFKTASLIANGCRATAIIGQCDRDMVELATTYGKHLGLAFQLIDDMLDYVGSEESLGKPVANDLRLGLATAPVLYAVKQFPELETLILRQFSHEGDIQRAQELVKKSVGLQQTKELAAAHCKRALDALAKFSNSVAKQALADLTETILNRQK